MEFMKFEFTDNLKTNSEIFKANSNYLLENQIKIIKMVSDKSHDKYKIF